MKKTTYNSHSEHETDQIARSIAEQAGDYTVFCLYGDLGAGKTTFTKALARHYGVSRRIISPTFVIKRSYPAHKKTLHHLDAYRISEDDHLDIEWISELMNDERSIIIIEWADRIKAILPERRIDIFFTLGEHEHERQITSILR